MLPTEGLFFSPPFSSYYFWLAGVDAEDDSGVGSLTSSH